MKYLLDTNIISETIRVKPSARVLNWLDSLHNQDIYISVLTLGEIRKGIESIKELESERTKRITMWLHHDLPSWFQDRILPIDQAVAHKWGFLMSQQRQTPSAIDSLLAATALSHNLCLTTRNVKDFYHFQTLEIFNPF